MPPKSSRLEGEEPGRSTKIILFGGVAPESFGEDCPFEIHQSDDVSQAANFWEGVETSVLLVELDQLSDSERIRTRIADGVRHGRCFFDRGLPDLIGYLSQGGHRAPDAWRAASRAYASAVFFAPPWREIFVNDAERPQSFAEAQELSAHIRRAYLDCGFHLIDLVKGSVADRLRQVLQYLDAHRPERDHG